MSTILSNQEGTDQIVGPDGTKYEPDAQGRFTVPDAFADALLSLHIAGEKAWDTEGERQTRLAAAELKRRQSPDALLDAVERLGGFDEPQDPKTRAAALRAEADLLDPPAKRPARKPAAKPKAPTVK